MAITTVTSRDRLQQLVDLGGKTMRYWYLIAIFAVVGGGLSFVFAMTRPKVYQSSATLFYQERIATSLLQGKTEEVQRNIAERYRELLLARSMLEQIIHDPKLNPYPEIKDDELAIDKLSQAIHFELRGASGFRITYSDSDPDRAQAVLAALTELLKDKDVALRNDQAQNTVDFADKQKAESGEELKKRQRALIDFLSKHPEFVADPNQPQGEGAGIRKNQDKDKNKPGQPAVAQSAGSARLYTLERQAARIQARLNAPPDAPPVHITAERTAEQKAADTQVQNALSEVNAATRGVEEAQSKGYTERHPEMIKAQDRLDGAKAKYAAAKAAVPPDAAETIVVPASAEDRVVLQKQLEQIQGQMADEERRLAKPAGTATTPAPAPVTPGVDDETMKIVKLEADHDDLQRLVDEQRKTDASLADAVYRAKIDAAQKRAEQDRLAVIDSANKPSKPGGPPKSIFLMAGMVLFVGLGLSLAVGLAVIDDRLYRRHDIEAFGVAVLAVIPPAGKAPKVKPPKQRKAKA